jgi:hypothetical protein
MSKGNDVGHLRAITFFACPHLPSAATLPATWMSGSPLRMAREGLPHECGIVPRRTGARILVPSLVVTARTWLPVTHGAGETRMGVKKSLNLDKRLRMAPSRR